ncbi:MAG: enoyl-CoA hydratase/isomerase family protein [Chloroflexi bacterium]|nr:enoyl-CoA hydratase/isomerase family protein [Chloroflexota bacterium]
MGYENILVERDGPVATITLNRPKVLNALNDALMAELVDALEALDRDESVRCLVLTGNERAFAAGADIRGLAEATPVHLLKENRLEKWDQIRRIGKPIVAACSGFVLGGGLELAMACDMIVASETAQFGQPEINLGIIPGAGGTQRLTRAVGKYRAMEMILTGRPIGAREAERLCLVNRVVPVEVYLAEAKRLAAEIASKSPLAVRLAKNAITRAEDLTIEEGLAYERHAFYLLFASSDQKEGMRAFVEKRKPQFTGE